MNVNVHIFVGSFGSREQACAYTEGQWETEPDDSVSDEEYQAWEDRNPIWQMREDLGVHLDSDFIETIYGPDRYDYLRTLLVDSADLDRVIDAADTSADTIVLIFIEALGGFEATMKSTPVLTYCGECSCDLSNL
jgi:hypothetical protein